MAISQKKLTAQGRNKLAFQIWKAIQCIDLLPKFGKRFLNIKSNCKSQRQKVIDSDQATLVQSALEVRCMDEKVCAADSEYLALVVANG